MSTIIPYRIRHSKLKLEGESPFRVLCPICEGLLLVQRLSCGWLSDADMCVLCGQRYMYEDSEIGGERVHRPIWLLLRWHRPLSGLHILPAFVGPHSHTLAVWATESEEPLMQLQLAPPADPTAFSEGTTLELRRGPSLLADGHVAATGVWGFERDAILELP